MRFPKFLRFVFAPESAKGFSAELPVGGLLGHQRGALAGGRCPDCGGTEFYIGPHGGSGRLRSSGKLRLVVSARTAIECVNPACRSWFNVGPGYASRIGPPPRVTLTVSLEVVKGLVAALEAVRSAIPPGSDHEDVLHTWLNYPEKPEQTPGTMMDKALRMARGRP